MRCQCFWPFLTIAIGAIIFAQPLGPIVFRCFSNFRIKVWGLFFVGNPKTTDFTTCSKLRQIVRIGVKGEKFTKMNISFGLTMNVYKIYDWIAFHMLWAAIKADKLLPSSKSYDFQCHNHNRCDYFCSTIGIDYFPMVFR